VKNALVKNGSITTQDQTVGLLAFGHGAVAIQITGTWSGTIQFEASLDGSTYKSLSVSPTNAGAAVTSATGNNVWVGQIAGINYVRVRASAFASGTAVVTIQTVPLAGAGGSSSGGGGGGGAVTISDGSDVSEGATTDAAVAGDNDGTIQSKLRYLNKVLADIWVSASHYLKVSIQNATLAVTQSGAWSVSSASNLAVSIDGANTVTLAQDTAYTPKHLVAAGSTNQTSVKASAGKLFTASVYNAALYPVYVKFHNTSGAPTAGVGIVLTVGVQAGSHRDVVWPSGWNFDTGIGMSIVKGIADNDATAVIASDCVVDLGYK
jgi:hypothetical protein